MAVLEQSWVKVQEKTFGKWLNSKLAVRGVHVDDLVRDVSDGTALIHLLEILSQESLGRYAAKPKLRVQRFENANIALDYIKGRKIQLTNIGARILWTAIGRSFWA